MIVIDLLTWLAIILLGIQAVIGLSFFVSSIYERERRATFFGLGQFAGMLILLLFFIVLAKIEFFDTAMGMAFLFLGYMVAGTAAFLLVRRTPANPSALKGSLGYITGQVDPVDEREIVFARVRSLRPGSDQYEAFYQKFPHLKKIDDERRSMGGFLGRLGAIDRPFDGPNTAATAATAVIPMALAAPEWVKPKAQALFMKDKTLSPDEATRRIKGFAVNIGADLVGIAEINPNWVYSHRGELWQGRPEEWGKKIENTHKYAVVVAEAMSLDMIGTAPHTPTVMESSKNYAKGAYISAQLAAFIANLGYSATANHLRHYELILPPVAVDAGLGEIGRLGYLMTKEFGPRIRLSAVTTDMPLIPDQPVDIGVEDFCRICKKCAACCPSKSIPEEDGQQETNGIQRWKLNEETCYGYWYKVGTDCCVCMNVCPWSHDRTFPHRLIVWMISRNRLARRLFNLMDDIFYGKRPKPKNAPEWAAFKSNA